MQVQVPRALLPIRLSAKVPRKTEKDGPGTKTPVMSVGVPTRVLRPWLQPCEYLLTSNHREVENNLSLTLCVFLPVCVFVTLLLCLSNA